MVKKNLYLLIILAVLAGAAYFYQGPWKKIQAQRSATKNFLAQLDFDKADKVEIIRKENTVKLTREGDKWKFNGEGNFYASSYAISNLKDTLSNAKGASLEVASSNKDKKADFDLSPDYGSEVKIFQGEKTLADFMVGRMSADYNGSYIGQNNDDNTYLIPVQLSSAFGLEWRDLSIFNFSKDNITSLRFQYPDRQFKLEKKDGKWTATVIADANGQTETKPFEAKEDKVNQVLTPLSVLAAEAIPAQKFDGTDLDKHLVVVEAKGDKGEHYVIMAGKNNGRGQYYTKRGDSDNIYLINQASYETLNKKVEDFN